MMLPDRERTVVVLRFIYDMTREECSNKLEISHERIRQAELKAFRRLRNRKYVDLLKDFLPSFDTSDSMEAELPVAPSIFSIEPSFREINLYAKKLPLLQKEKKRQQKEREEQERISRQREREAQLMDQRNALFDKLIKAKADQEEKELWWRSECESEFDQWYKERMGRPLKENKIKKEDIPHGNNPRFSVEYV